MRTNVSVLWQVGPDDEDDLFDIVDDLLENQ
jgi:hypothetical protein